MNDQEVVTEPENLVLPLWRVTSGDVTTVAGLRAKRVNGKTVLGEPVDIIVSSGQEPAPGADGIAPGALASEPVPAGESDPPPAAVQ